jgi:uncharacterized peroxidase-related enzyme
MHDYTQAKLDPQTRGMLDFAVKLTREPWSMQEADVQGLRDLGLSDEQVLSVVLITCCFNFADRLVDALGLPVTADSQQALQGWLTGPAAQQQWLFPGDRQIPSPPG